MDCFILGYKRGSIQQNLRTRKMKKNIPTYIFCQFTGGRYPYHSLTFCGINAQVPLF